MGGSYMTSTIASRPRILGLTDRGLDLLLDEAHLIDPSLRPAFLNKVMRLLLLRQSVSDGDVTRVCDHVSRSLRHPKAKAERERQQELERA
jgi:hypothetical protein